MLNVDYTLIIQIVNFLFLLFVLNRIVYRPIRGVLNKRKEEMLSSEEKTSDWKQKADRFSEELEENMVGTRKEGQKEKESLKDQGLEQEREMIREAYSSVEENIEKVKAEIHERVALASGSLQSELEGFSRELAEKMLGRSI
jgi:F-type H+-transporting ATPase subunit b